MDKITKPQIRHIGYHNFSKNHNNLSSPISAGKRDNEKINYAFRKGKIEGLINKIDNCILFFSNTSNVINTNSSFQYNDYLKSNVSYKEIQKLKLKNHNLKEEIYEMEEKLKNYTYDNNESFIYLKEYKKDKRMNFILNKHEKLIKENKKLKEKYNQIKVQYQNSQIYIYKDKIKRKMNNLDSIFSKFLDSFNSSSNQISQNNTNSNYIKNNNEYLKKEENEDFFDDENINFTEGDNLYTSSDENESSNQIQIPLKQFEIISNKGTPFAKSENGDKNNFSKITYTNNSINSNRIIDRKKNIKNGFDSLSKIGPAIIENLSIKNNKINSVKGNNTIIRNNKSNKRVSKKI